MKSGKEGRRKLPDFISPFHSSLHVSCGKSTGLEVQKETAAEGAAVIS
jgi:hypothetical protein